MAQRETETSDMELRITAPNSEVLVLGGQAEWLIPEAVADMVYRGGTKSSIEALTAGLMTAGNRRFEFRDTDGGLIAVYKIGRATNGRTDSSPDQA